jgi:hypothetical protein
VSVVGHAVLYAAFAAVALWLLGELLLQHRAEPHWRALALLGFLGLVAGVSQGSLPLIGAGVVAFGVGQYLVSRSVRTGGRTHWSLRAADGALPGPLARLPLLGTVFPAGEAESGVLPPPVPLVGEVGPVEPLEALEPEQAVQAAPQGYPYDYGQQQTFDHPATEYVASEYAGSEYQQQPLYANEYNFPQQQQEQPQQEQPQPQYDYNGYEQHPQQPAYAAYDYGQQQPEQTPYYGYDGQQQSGYYEPQYQQQGYAYQPVPVEPVEQPEPEAEAWQPYPPQQYS